jgi:hypothetical protein
MHQLQPNLSHVPSLFIPEDQPITAQILDQRFCLGGAQMISDANLPAIIP